jgi:hypothetical protein
MKLKRELTKTILNLIEYQIGLGDLGKNQLKETHIDQKTPKRIATATRKRRTDSVRNACEKK